MQRLPERMEHAAAVMAVASTAALQVFFLAHELALLAAEVGLFFEALFNNKLIAACIRVADVSVGCVFRLFSMELSFILHFLRTLYNHVFFDDLFGVCHWHSIAEFY